MRRMTGMFGLLFVRYRTHPPVMTLALVASCLVTTIPQALLPDSYSATTGMTGLASLPLFTLPTFSHDPAILFLHVTLNSLVFLFFWGDRRVDARHRKVLDRDANNAGGVDGIGFL